MGKSGSSHRRTKSDREGVKSKSSSSSCKDCRKSKRKSETGAEKESVEKKKRSESSYKSDEINFENFVRELNQAFFRNTNFVEDVDDFWLFLKKYEGVRKKAELKQKDNFDKTLLLNVSLNCDVSDIYYYKLLPDDRKVLSKDHLRDFRNIILIYNDFKQKEKFSKLKKLRLFQNDLPVAQYKDNIIESVNEKSVVIIAGDTGCGKSTQIPQYLLKAGYRRIACTQPRRIACTSLCKRVAKETLSEFKSNIGYQIRFEKHRNKETNILFITEGLLLRQLSNEDDFPGYDVIVLDEIHERHVNGDFLVGIVKCLLYYVKNLKIVLMSATININLFSDYFGDLASIIQVPGRLHPIKLYYKPISLEEQVLKASKTDRIDPAPYVQIMQLIDSKYPRSERGDLLIFLSGMAEIVIVVGAAQQYNEKLQTWIILPLHSWLSLTDQEKVFNYAPEGMRKCIVSTNIAETSVTIDGIRFVVDSGKVKEMSYDPVTKMQRLKEFTISKASAEQRKGRAGRTGPGVCYRLYSEEEYNTMDDYTTPELQRCPLDSLLLQMIVIGLPDARKFPFIEAPPLESIETAILSLKKYGALTEDEKITDLGRMLSKLPIDIPLSKMLITATMLPQLDLILSLVSALSVQTPFTNRSYADSECEILRKELDSDHGDPITLLNAFREWLAVKYKTNSHRVKGSHSSKQWCRKRGLEEQRFYEMIKLRTQLQDLLTQCGLLHMSDDNVTGSKGEMTSSERALRHGEMKILKSMKRSYQQSDPRKPKVLKPDTYQIYSPDNEGCCSDGEVDIRDIDFRLTNDRFKVQHLVSGSTACSFKDLMMLKVVLCSGMYPGVAIPDEFNHCAGVNKQLFHTKDKPFVWLFPMSYFGNSPEVLQLNDSDIVDPPDGFPIKNPLSQKHQVLFYMSLLETTKPYLMNVLRMPAAQSLLLFALEIHTNHNFTRIVCDSWVELYFTLGETGEALLLKVCELRSLWKRLLKLKLEDQDVSKIESDFTDSVLHLMNLPLIYAIKRLLAADVKIMYKEPAITADDSTTEECYHQMNPFVPDFPVTKNSKVGGLQLAPYLTYDCLYEDCVSFENWKCPNCDMVAALSPLERLQHKGVCQPRATKIHDGEEDKPVIKKPNSRHYWCPECNENFYFTPTDILKHKKFHQQVAS